MDTKGKVIIVAGMAGTGKTKIGKEIAKKFKYAYLDKDTISNLTTEKIISLNNSYEGDRETEVYVQARELEYATLFNIMKENIDLGVSVVVSAPYTKEISNEKWYYKLQNKLNTKVLIIWITADSDVKYHRILLRDDLRDYYKLSHWEEYSKETENINVNITTEFLLQIDNSKDEEFEKNLNKIYDWIKKQTA